MLFADYTPSWNGAFKMFLVECLVLGVLVVALFLYSRRRHARRWVVAALGIGLLTGQALVLGLVWWDWAVSEPSPGFSREDLVKADIIALFESGFSGVFGFAGLLAGWLVLESVGLIRRKLAFPITRSTIAPEPPPARR